MTSTVPTPKHRALRILHLSDTHLMAGDARHYGIVDTTAALHRVLDRAADATDVDAVVLSGDLSEDGTPETYQALADIVQPWAAQRQATVVYAMGNHDLPEGFSAILGDRDGVREIRGFRIVHLDSSVPGAGYGEITAEQLQWLAAQLRQPAEHGTVLVLHHPPVPASTELLAGLELQRPQELLDVCAAGDVRLVLSGHYHHPLVSRVGEIDIAVAPGITNTSDILAPAPVERSLRGSGFAVVDLPVRGPARVTAIAVPGPQDGTVVSELSPDQIARIVRQAGPPVAGGPAGDQPSG